MIIMSTEKRVRFERYGLFLISTIVVGVRLLFFFLFSFVGHDVNVIDFDGLGITYV